MLSLGGFWGSWGWVLGRLSASGCSFAIMLSRRVGGVPWGARNGSNGSRRAIKK